MNFRRTAGTCILLVILAVLPAAALPDVSEFSVSPRAGGYATVVYIDANGTAIPDNVAIAYSMGSVSELPASAVYEDRDSGTVTVTMKQTSPVRRYTLRVDNITKSVDDNDTYFIRGIAVASKSEPLLVNNMAFSAVPATANYYADTVPEGSQHEWVDLDWKDPSKDLGLTVYAPDKTFGPYSDAADGRKDGRIFLDIASRFNVTPGSWFFSVRNSNPVATPYTLNTYSA